jgi:hypothetical protein
MAVRILGAGARTAGARDDERGERLVGEVWTAHRVIVNHRDEHVPISIDLKTGTEGTTSPCATHMCRSTSARPHCAGCPAGGGEPASRRPEHRGSTQGTTLIAEANRVPRDPWISMCRRASASSSRARRRRPASIARRPPSDASRMTVFFAV